MSLCDYCNTESDNLIEFYSLDYSQVLFRVCLNCSYLVFLCPLCLELRSKTEETMNQKCIYCTKYGKSIEERLAELEAAVAALQNED